MGKFVWNFQASALDLVAEAWTSSRTRKQKQKPRIYAHLLVFFFFFLGTAVQLLVNTNI